MTTETSEVSFIALKLVDRMLMDAEDDRSNGGGRLITIHYTSTMDGAIRCTAFIGGTGDTRDKYIFLLRKRVVISDLL